MRGRSLVPRSRRAVICALAGALVGLAPVPPPAAAADPKSVQEELQRAARDYDRVLSDLGRIDGKMRALEQELAQADKIIAQRSVAIRMRAGHLYKTGNMTLLEGLLTAPDLGVFLKRLQLIGILQEKDARLIDGIQITKSRAGEIRENLERARAREKSLLELAKARQRALEAKLRTAKSSSKVASFGKFEGFTLPIIGPVAFSDSWGAPRSGGRRHRGTDVMGPCGARVSAVTSGVVQSLRSGGNGGIMLYLRARNGDVFFYAHLRSYAPGMRAGRAVQVGELIGYNGNTGNARGGPCHVHFEWHPAGGKPVNPYRLLRSALA